MWSGVGFFHESGAAGLTWGDTGSGVGGLQACLHVLACTWLSVLVSIPGLKACRLASQVGSGQARVDSIRPVNRWACNPLHAERFFCFAASVAGRWAVGRQRLPCASAVGTGEWGGKGEGAGDARPVCPAQPARAARWRLSGGRRGSRQLSRRWGRGMRPGSSSG